MEVDRGTLQPRDRQKKATNQVGCFVLATSRVDYSSPFLYVEIDLLSPKLL